MACEPLAKPDVQGGLDERRTLSIDNRNIATFRSCPSSCMLLVYYAVQRNPLALTSKTFDLLVVGGGIYGAISAWDATLRGLSVALIDRGDFGGGTSFNNAKILHSGVRALQSGNVAALRRFVRERRTLSRIVPHLVQPMRFVIPTYRSLGRNRTLLHLYFSISDLLTRDRNDQIQDTRRLSPSRALSREECLRLNPLIDPSGVTGGIQWFDSQMYNSDRVHFSFVVSAVEAGAVAVNYVEAVTTLTRDRAVVGVQAFDHLTGEPLDIRARVVLNAAGPWAPALSGRLHAGAGRALHGHLLKAMNIVIPRPLPDTHAIGAETGGRFLFVAPWREFAIVGTSYHRHDGPPDRLALDRREIDTFINAINLAFPRLSLDIRRVRLVHRGLLPASLNGSGLRPTVKSTVVDHRRDGILGLVSMLGVRYTTARDTAERAIDIVTQQLQRATSPCRTMDTPLVGAAIANVDAFFRDVASVPDATISRQALDRLARTYGTRYRAVLERLRMSDADRAPLSPDCPITVGEIRHSVRNEMAVKLTDALLRRTEAGSGGHPGDAALESAARIMAAELDWTLERVNVEIADARGAFKIPT